MEANPDDVVKAFSCCEAFGAQLAHPMQQKAMRWAGGVRAITTAMRRWPDNMSLQSVCSGASCAMTLWDETNNRAFFEAGLTKLQLDGIKKWGHVTPAHGLWGQNGCLMDFIPEHRIEFAKQGGIELFIELAYKYSNVTDAEIQQSIWDTFTTFCGEPNQQHCVDANILELYIMTMKKHPFTGRVRQEVLQSSRAVATGGPKFRKKLIESDFAEEIVKTITENPTRRAEMSVACGNIFVLLEDEDSSNRKFFVKIGAIEAILNALQLDESTFLTKSQ